MFSWNTYAGSISAADKHGWASELYALFYEFSNIVLVDAWKNIGKTKDESNMPTKVKHFKFCLPLHIVAYDAI